MSDNLTRAGLIAGVRFQQSMGAIVSNPSRRSPYGLQAQTGTLGVRDLKTGDRAFTDAAGVSSNVRDLKTGAYPRDRVASAIQIIGGQNYVR